jgi:hypothetical protein
MSAGENSLDAIERCLEWFNTLSPPGRDVHREDIARLFTSDMKMTINGEVRCEGLEGLFGHFSNVRHRLKSWRVELPLRRAYCNGEDVAGYFLIHLVTPDERPAIMHVAALWKVREERMASTVEVSHVVQA